MLVLEAARIVPKPESAIVVVVVVVVVVVFAIASGIVTRHTVYLVEYSSQLPPILPFAQLTDLSTGRLDALTSQPGGVDRSGKEVVSNVLRIHWLTWSRSSPNHDFIALLWLLSWSVPSGQSQLFIDVEWYRIWRPQLLPALGKRISWLSPRAGSHFFVKVECSSIGCPALIPARW